ncbi:HAMP domain-containing sensor histidine kinase [Mechercharimyces sp. CAU 1602]|uniref:sensor histidine kinase n=1 Tax=Mechercharimyces sp. CAU 1602 TaxID=2973933 RepID=UPI002163504C|nr:HAMP domain-containing sensor histidine kinase [Mechercharimyces sp. CAU 1602]MCS1351944.1 HAMP domain-containing histidine kinase [Mechercharimyces sp. CAU 1602]
MKRWLSVLDMLKNEGKGSMLYYFIVLLVVAIAIAGVRPESIVNRWAAFFLISASLGGLVPTIEEWVRAGHALPGWIEWANQTWTPFGVLMFAYAYAGWKPARKNEYGWWLFPVICSWILYPFLPQGKVAALFLIMWVGPYYVLACYVLLRSTLREPNPLQRRKRWMMTAIVVPTVLGILVLINGMRLIRPNFDFFPYVSLLIGYSLLLGIISLFLYGVLGIRIRVEREQLERTLRSAESGTSLFHHTIKGEIGKISLGADNLRGMLSGEERVARRQLEIIASSAQHMKEMAARMHSLTQKVALLEEWVVIDLLLDDVRLSFADQWKEARMRTVVVGEKPLLFYCDPVHMREVLTNLVQNAFEAATPAATLEIRVERTARHAVLTVTDTGAGIAAEHIERAHEPFFTTKGKKTNYGLGLSYVYQVVREMNGKISLQQHQPQGTEVRLQFSPERLIAMQQEEKMSL